MYAVECLLGLRFRVRAFQERNESHSSKLQNQNYGNDPMPSTKTAVLFTAPAIMHEVAVARFGAREELAHFVPYQYGWNRQSLAHDDEKQNTDRKPLWDNWDITRCRAEMTHS
jgi:hypothetical protein